MPTSDWPEWSVSDLIARRPVERINQLGYLPRGPKHATWVTDEPLPAEFRVVAADGSTALRGPTQAWQNRPEPTSGQSVHVLDFTELTTPGVGYQLLVRGQRSHPFRIAEDVYEQLARDAFGLFYLLRSGCPIDEDRVPGYGRPAGHTGVPPNQGDTTVPAWTGPEADRLYPEWKPTGPHGFDFDRVAGPATRGFADYHLNVATWTNQPPKRPTTSAFGGTHHSPTSRLSEP